MPRPKTIDDSLILDRALQTFWQRGYAGASMRDLSEATGLSVASLYNRFADKDGLFVEAINRYADAGLTARLTRLSASSDPLPAIRRFFDEVVALSMSDSERRGCLLVNSALDGGAMSQTARDVVRARLGEVEAFFRVQIGRARDLGQICNDVRPRDAAEVLFGAVLAIRVLARLDPRRGRLRRLADAALTQVLGRSERRLH